MPALCKRRKRSPGKPELRVEAVRLRSVEGSFTGETLDPPLGGPEKVKRIKAVAEEEGLDLGQSHAYGDSHWDLPLLEAVGRPAAVNPDRRLLSAARARGWPVLHFKSGPEARPS